MKDRVDNPGDESRSQLFSRQSVLALYVPTAILAVGNGIIAPALPVYAKSFGVKFGVASIVITAYLIGSAISTLPAGYLLDRVGRRKVLLSGPLLMAAALFAAAAARSFPELVAFRLVAGVANEMWTLARLAIITDTGARRERGRQITGINSLQRSGRLAGPLIGGFIAVAIGVRVDFIIYGVLALIAAVPVYLTLQETAPAKPGASDGKNGTQPEQHPSMRELITRPVLVFFGAQLLASLTRGILMGGMLDLYAVYHYGVSAAVVGLLVSAMTVVGTPINLTAGYVMDRFGRKATIVPGFSLLAVAMAFMMLTSYLRLPFLIFAVSYICVNASQNITGGSMQTLGSDIAPLHARGKFFGIWRMIGEGGTSLSPIMFALLSGLSSFTASFLFVTCTSAGVALLVGTQIRETVQRRRAPSVSVTGDKGPEASPATDPAGASPGGAGAAREGPREKPG